ncbi:hypothetical protein [Woodsholea maritima]|uniref:hypothetical protein n=1 Tax=Woodsholea maritima TaxID=240237 RepID=UPI0012EABADB|nr:hypothetical protein [Woodsholea maritima]
MTPPNTPFRATARIRPQPPTSLPRPPRQGDPSLLNWRMSQDEAERWGPIGEVTALMEYWR